MLHLPLVTWRGGERATRLKQVRRRYEEPAISRTCSGKPELLPSRARRPPGPERAAGQAYEVEPLRKMRLVRIPEALDGLAPEHLLLGDGALGASATEEGDGPVQERGQAGLEPD